MLCLENKETVNALTINLRDWLAQRPKMYQPRRRDYATFLSPITLHANHSVEINFDGTAPPGETNFLMVFIQWFTDPDRLFTFRSHLFFSKWPNQQSIRALVLLMMFGRAPSPSNQAYTYVDSSATILSLNWFQYLFENFSLNRQEFVLFFKCSSLTTIYTKGQLNLQDR